MFVFVQIVFWVYILAINAYGFILVYLRQKDEEDCDCKPNNSKLLIAALLGGALGVYVAMFVFQYRLDSLILMVFLPVIIVLNGFVIWKIFSDNFGFLPDGHYIVNRILNFKFKN